MAYINNKEVLLAALKGDKGDAGYTPQKGVDYYTDAEKEELMAEVAEYANAAEECKEYVENQVEIAATSATAAQTAQAVAERNASNAEASATYASSIQDSVEQLRIRTKNYADDSKTYVEEAQALLEQVREEMGNMPGVSVVDPVNVKDLGAVGDGDTDDSEVIQLALETYNDIYFPEGIYRVKGLTINKSNKKIVGENATLKIVDVSDVLGGTSLASVGLYIVSNEPENPVSNIVIDGINFDGNGQWFLDNGRDPTDRSGDGTCIRMYNAKNVTIRNCCFDNFIRRGIGSSVPFYKDNHTHYGVHGLHISDCEFNKKPLPSKYVTIPAGATYKDGTAANAGVYKVYALGNAIQLLQTGKDAKDTDVVVERCTVHKSSNYGFMFYPLKENLTVRDCKIMNCGLNTSEDSYTKADGTKVYADYGYYCSTTDYDKADHCDGGGIKLNNPHNALVERCYIYGVRGSNISVHNATLGADYTQEMLDAWGCANNIVIRNNEIVGNPDQARCGNGIIVEGGDNVKIIDNKIVNHIGAQRQHKVHSDKVYDATKAISSNVACFIDGNTIENDGDIVYEANVKESGVVVAYKNVVHGGLEVFEGTVSHNTIINAKNPIYASKAQKGDVTYYVKNLTIEGNNFIHTNSSLGTVKGVDIQYVDVNGGDGSSVSGNNFTGFARGVQVFASSKNTNIFGNAFYDCTRPIVAGISDNDLEAGGTSNKHDNLKIYGNSFIRNNSPQENNTITFENVKKNATVDFKPSNATIDDVPVT